MVKRTEAIRRQQAANCFSVYEHSVGLAFKGLRIAIMKNLERKIN